MSNFFRREVLPGLFIVIAVILLVILIFTIKPPGMMNKTYDLRVRFDTIAGLRENAPVWFAGVEKYQGRDVGKVKQIKIISVPDNESEGNKVQIEVLLAVNRQIPLKVGLQFRIATKGLAGYPHVEIIPGRPDAPDIDRSGIINGNRPPDDMFTTMQELTDIVKAMKLDVLGPKIHRTVEKIGDLSENLNYTVQDVRHIVANLKEEKNVEKIMANLKQVTAKANITVDELNSFITKLDGTRNKVDLILDENREDIKTIFTNVADFSVTLNTKLDNTITNIDILATNINKFLKENKDDIKDILVNLKLTTQNAKLFSQDIKMNPWKLLFKTKEKKLKQMLKPLSDKGVY